LTNKAKALPYYMPVKFNYFILFFFLTLLFSLFSSNIQAQKEIIKNDTIAIDSSKLHSPKLATIMSACIPGLGQVYNKKYWKVPLVYAGFGVIGYSIKTNGDKYNKFHTAYVERMDNDTTTIDKIYLGYSNADIKIRNDYYRRNRDLSYIFGVIWYVLNILDATVDAHLFFFNIDDNLSLNVKPASLPLYYKSTSSTIPGLTFSFNIGKSPIVRNNKPKICL